MARPFELLLNGLFRLFVRVASRMDPWVRFEIHDATRAPLRENFLTDLAQFRARAYQKRLPHLAEKFTLQAGGTEENHESHWDLRSIHVIARRRYPFSLSPFPREEKIIAAVRFTPAPFEMNDFIELNHDEQANLEKDALEIGRLISNTRIPFVGRRLLFIGGEYIWSNTRYRALAAICRAEKLPLFQSFGLKPISEPFWFDERKGNYTVIWGDLTSVISAVRGAFKKRLREYFRFKPRRALPGYSGSKKGKSG
ncbi:MAG: hypothetical protein JNL01_01510 [Bdellovibrionales bacterium]|nr:hypothetical protein [Bdellovibrionales bacterium]